jgi:hypothetical protein
VQLNDLLDAFDRTAANLAKLEKIWERAETFIPKAPAGGSEGDPFGGPVAMRLGVGGSWSTVGRTRME